MTAPCTVSWETAGSDGSEPLAVDMSRLLGCCVATFEAVTAVCRLALGGHEVPAAGGLLFARGPCWS
jgi:hypothetical protein